MPLPTLADLKAELNITSTANDGELADKLDQAVDVVEGIVGPVTTTTVTETHYGVYAPVLVLRKMPVDALLSVSSGSGVAASPLVSSLFELDAEAGLLRRVDGGWFSGSFTVSYSAGRPAVPPAIHGAILIIAGHLWETQRGASPSALALQGEDFGAVAPGVGFAIPNRARDLLARYVVVKTGIA